jgi:deoxyribose-phosphate aldolase
MVNIINLIDLTSLNTIDVDDNIIKLVGKAKTPKGYTAAICIYKEFLATAKQEFKNNNIHTKDLDIATVINFSTGDNTLKSTLIELEYCINQGATEIDLVMPYKQLIANNISFVENYINHVRKNCSVLLKVIIESGELKTEALISLASKISINNGADFIKTSTGKVQVNATLEAAEIMLNTIKAENPKCGFKAAGGVRTVEEANAFINLASKIMGESYVNKKTFRFGASGLLDNVLNGSISKANY